jgi:predicted metal-dependent peptidase
MSEITKKISDARAILMQKCPFWGYIACYLTPVQQNNIPSVATDGKHLFYNKDFLQARSIKDIMFIFAHEIAHILLGHIQKRQAPDKFKWNIACDYAANGRLQASGLQVPYDALIDREYSELSAEEIYKKLPKDIEKWAEKVGLKKYRDFFESDILLPASGKDSDLRELVRRAEEYTRRRGYLPAGVEEIINGILRPKVNWHRLLYLFMQDVVKNDYTYLRPNRRYMLEGIIMPSLYNHQIGKIVVALDTSDSISDKEIRQFLTEFVNLAKSLMVDELYFVTCDAKVHQFYRFKSYEVNFERLRKIKGRGGTDFRPVFEKIKEEGIRPACLVYLTDGYGEYPQTPPPYPVLWVLTCDYRSALPDMYKPPFGKCIYLK